ncbi:MAG: glycosyltransferase [Pseudomonadota bacterium]
MATPQSLNTPVTLVSVIVPVHDDDARLRQLLPQLLSQPHVGEVIVSASAESDALVALCDAPNIVLTHSARGRGLQLNHGASLAQHAVLWFVHADAQVPAQAARYICNRVDAGDVGGWFAFGFHNAPSPAANRFAALINWRARHGVAYGDQGLFFRREAFVRFGGFEPVALFEEVRLFKTAKAAGRFHASHLTIGVDARRWQSSGWIRRTLSNRALALCHALGIAPDTLAHWYAKHR